MAAESDLFKSSSNTQIYVQYAALVTSLVDNRKHSTAERNYVMRGSKLRLLVLELLKVYLSQKSYYGIEALKLIDLANICLIFIVYDAVANYVF